MHRPHRPQFRGRAVELARMHEKPIAQIASDLGRSRACGTGCTKPMSTTVGVIASRARIRRSSGQLRRELRIAEDGGRDPQAAAFFAQENSSQNDLHLHRRALLGPASRDPLSCDEGCGLPASISGRPFSSASVTGPMRSSPTRSWISIGCRGARMVRLGCTPSCARGWALAALANGSSAGCTKRASRGRIGAAGGAAPARDPAGCPAMLSSAASPTLRAPDRLLGDGRHRAPHRRGHGASRWCPRCVQPPGGGVGARGRVG